ncbi:MAG: LamG-like jellyroll fold domain-containing protein, partial [Saprospiraceae bacterium]|nr:LamG-like jellyroll fold domain-containing protein [Saprospiraceae bacterium]
LQNYDPEAVSGFRFNDESWYRHHLTNISGLFSFNATALNPRIASQSLQVDLSGSMVSLERVFTGANLDFSTIQAMGPSGFSAGCWMYLPSGDLETQGNGSSGLFGDHMFMGAWSQETTEQSWFIGMSEGALRGRVVLGDGTLREFSTNLTPVYNAPFFVGLDMQPSGGSLLGRMVYSEDATDFSLDFIHESTFGVAAQILQPASASGFSLFNGPNLDYGFPSGTRMNNPFVFGGAPNETEWISIKRAGVNEVSLGSGSISATDPDNISHWKFDTVGSRFIDFGKEQNYLYPVNLDGHIGGVFEAIHGSGVVVREQEYLDTLPFNPNSRRLDLGSGTQSWTFLGWVKPPIVSDSDEHTIMAKSASLSGIRVFTPADSLQLTANASGNVCRGENGNLAPNEWNHIAVVYDRDNNEFGTYINGRYAGT